MRLSGDTVDAGGLALRMLLLHVYLQSLLILVMPIAFRTLESFARVPTVDAGQRSTWASQSTTGQDQFAFRAFDSARSPLHVFRTDAYSCASEEIRWLLGQRGVRRRRALGR